jgi:hypothetical protein
MKRRLSFGAKMMTRVGRFAPRMNHGLLSNSWTNRDGMDVHEFWDCKAEGSAEECYCLRILFAMQRPVSRFPIV